ncbi:MAG: CHASE3 domain-containing protein [Opitutaceae bacterium]|nr:CHASE3 domain-containing protein [Opitutaceae bacterium]
MKDATLSRIFAFFLAIFAVVVGVAVAAVININRAGASRDWVNHTYATISAFENILAAVHAGDAHMRTFALSGDARDFAASREAFGAMDEYLQIADALTRESPAVQAELREVGALAQRRSDFAEAVGQARRGNQLDRVRQLLADEAGADPVGVVRRRLEKLRDDQFTQLREREQLAYRQAQTTRWIVGVGVGCNLILFCAVGWLIRDDLRARHRAARALEEANAQLEDKVRARTAELIEANGRLSAENLERKWAAQSQDHQLRYNQAIVNSVNELVFVVTRALAITRINPAVVRATRLDDTALLGRPLAGLVSVPGESDPALTTLIRTLAAGRELHDVPISIAGRDAHLNLFPLRDRDKVVGGIVVIQLASAPSPGNP